MCTISHQKCVCFVFLVVLAVLSCSGFRIDNLTMTDVSKRNSGALDALAGGAHRLRHRRNMPSACIRRRQCPEVDVSWKAFKATATGAIAVARLESNSATCKSNSRGNCTVQFKIDEWVAKPKYSSTNDDELIRLNFINRGGYCESEDPAKNWPCFLVKPKNEPSEKYILFLRTNGPHRYEAAYAPEVYKNRTYKTVLKVVKHEYKQRPLRLTVSQNQTRKRLRLQCKVRGFPIPVITWKVNNVTLHQNNRIRITHKKRKSTLTIRNVTEADRGKYMCVAKSADGKSSSSDYVTFTASKPKEKSKPKATRPTERPGISSTVSDSDRKPCGGRMKANYCQNNGTCFYTESIDEYSCECPNRFEGKRCEEKTSYVGRTYVQSALGSRRRQRVRHNPNTGYRFLQLHISPP